MSPAAWILTAGGIYLLLAVFFSFIRNKNQSDVFGLNPFIGTAAGIFMAASVVLLTVWFALCITGGERKRIECAVKKRLFDPRYGNPLGFRDGELLPPVKCRKINSTTFDITIDATSRSVEDLLKITPVISSAITGRYKQYAVITLP